MRRVAASYHGFGFVAALIGALSVQSSVSAQQMRFGGSGVGSGYSQSSGSAGGSGYRGSTGTGYYGGSGYSGSSGYPRSSGYSAGSGSSGSLPAPTPGTFGPQTGQYNSGQYASNGTFSHNHHSIYNKRYPYPNGSGYAPSRYSNGGYYNGAYNPYPFGPPHAVNLQVQNFSWPSQTANVKPASPEPAAPAELLAKAKKLGDDKPAQ